MSKPFILAVGLLLGCGSSSFAYDHARLEFKQKRINGDSCPERLALASVAAAASKTERGFRQGVKHAPINFAVLLSDRICLYRSGCRA